jgi:hypothetical protein
MKDLTRSEFLALFQKLSKGGSKAQVCKSFGITEKDLQRQVKEFSENETVVSLENFTLRLIARGYIMGPQDMGPQELPNLEELNPVERRLAQFLNTDWTIGVIAQSLSLEMRQLITITALNGRIGRLYKKLGVHTRLHLRAVLLVIELNK